MDDGTYCIGNPGEGIMQRGLHARLRRGPSRRPSRSGATRACSSTPRSAAPELAGARVVRLLAARGELRRRVRAVHERRRRPEHLGRLRLLRLLHQRERLTRITNKGPLSNDRRHQFKVSGVYFTPWKLSVGLAAYLRSGTPLTRYGYSDAYGRYEFFLIRAGRGGADARQLRRGPASRLCAQGRAVHGQSAARRLQPVQHAAADPARPALGIPGGGQRFADAGEPALREAGAADAAHDVAARFAGELLRTALSAKGGTVTVLPWPPAMSKIDIF